jgi:hypothetical protein
MNISVKYLVFLLIIVSAGIAEAGGAGVGIHSGYGVIEYDEHSVSMGSPIESESSQDVILFGVSGEYSFSEPINFFGVSGEYSFSEPINFYVGVTTDWAFGQKDNEITKDHGFQIQSNDMRIFSQFYDFRFGYKNSGRDYYYRIYVAGGWDGIHIKRDEFVFQSETVSGAIKEDFSLWRAGAGAGFGYTLSNWALDGRIAYAYYVSGEIKNGSFPQHTFDTNGSCLDMGVGIARKITNKTSAYIGVSYTLLELDESEIIQNGLMQAVFPQSKTEILTGVVNLNYSF